MVFGGSEGVEVDDDIVAPGNGVQQLNQVQHGLKKKYNCVEFSIEVFLKIKSLKKKNVCRFQLKFFK